MRSNSTKTSGQVRVARGYIAEAIALLRAGKPYWRGKLRQNPVTGHRFVCGIDPLRREVIDAAAALQARARFAELHPDLPPLPLCWSEREALKRKGVYLGLLVAWFAASLASVGYGLEAHPSFEAFVRNDVLSDPELRQHLPAGLVDKFLSRGVQ